MCSIKINRIRHFWHLSHKKNHRVNVSCLKSTRCKWRIVWLILYIDRKSIRFDEEHMACQRGQYERKCKQNSHFTVLCENLCEKSHFSISRLLSLFQCRKIFLFFQFLLLALVDFFPHSQKKPFFTQLAIRGKEIKMLL